MQNIPFETPTVSDSAAKTLSVSENFPKHQHEKEEKAKAENGYRINCLYCGEESMKKSPNAKFCSTKHRILYYNERNRGTKRDLKV